MRMFALAMFRLLMLRIIPAKHAFVTLESNTLCVIALFLLRTLGGKVSEMISRWTQQKTLINSLPNYACNYQPLLQCCDTTTTTSKKSLITVFTLCSWLCKIMSQYEQVSECETKLPKFSEICRRKDFVYNNMVEIETIHVCAYSLYANRYVYFCVLCCKPQCTVL